MPHHISHNQYFKNWKKLGYQVLPQPSCSPDLLPTNNHFFNNFFQGQHFHSQQEAENAFQEFIKSWNRFLCYRSKQTFFLLAKCIACNGFYFYFKKTFEPSYYNDAKFKKTQLLFHQPKCTLWGRKELNKTEWLILGFFGASDSKETAYYVGNLDSIPGSGRCLREGNGTPLYCFCLKNTMDRGVMWATVHGIVRSQTWLSD